MILHVLLEDGTAIKSYSIPLSSILYLEYEYTMEGKVVDKSKMTINFNHVGGSLEIETEANTKVCFRLMEGPMIKDVNDSLYESNSIADVEKDLLICMGELSSETIPSAPIAI